VAANPGSGERSTGADCDRHGGARGGQDSFTAAVDRALVVTVAGEIDLVTADQVRAALAAGVDHLRDGDILVIDLIGVTWLSSTGLQVPP
jgi:hypothetical protein